MFFRGKKTRKARVLQLVENHCNAEGKVRLRVVVSLGGCPVPDEHRKRVAAEITRRMAEYQRLLPEEPAIEYRVNRVLGIDWTLLPVRHRTYKKGQCAEM